MLCTLIWRKTLFSSYSCYLSVFTYIHTQKYIVHKRKLVVLKPKSELFKEELMESGN